MKEDLKKCIQFDPSINNIWLYHFKINQVDYEGEKQQCYLKECNFLVFSIKNKCKFLILIQILGIIVALISVLYLLFLFCPVSDFQMPTVHLKKQDKIRSEILVLAQAKEPGALMVIWQMVEPISLYWQLDKRKEKLVKIVLGTQS